MATSKLQLLIDLKNRLKVGLDAAKQQVTQATGSMQKRLDAFKTKNIDVFNAIKDEVPGVGRALSMLANPYVLIAAVVLSAGAAMVKFTGMANRWHESLAEINVTAEMTKDELGSLSGKLLEIGARNVAPLEEVPKAFNRIISAGLDVTQSLATLEPTLRAAKAGFADMETVAGAAVSVMKSAGKDATRVYDILFETVKEGNAEFKDIARYLPKVIPLARNVGFALEETAGAFASLTTKLSPEQSTTALEGIMRSLSDSRIVKNFKGLGIEVFDKDTNQVRPILDIIKDLNKQMDGLSDKQRMLKFDSLGIDQMSTLGFSTLLQDIPALQKAIDATTNSQGALEKAYKDSLTPMESWKIVSNALKAEAIKIGEIFLPVVSAIGEKVLGAINYFKELYKNSQMFRDAIAVLGAIVGSFFRLQLMPMRMFINLLKLAWGFITAVVQGIGNLIAKITGIEGGFKGLYDRIRPYLIWMKDLSIQIFDILYDVFTFNFKGAKEKFRNFKLPRLDEIKQRIKIETETGDFAGVDNETPEGSNQDSTVTTSTNDLQSITRGGQTKNITINIDSFIKSFTPVQDSINGMSKDQLERWLTDMFLRVVNSAEHTT